MRRLRQDEGHAPSPSERTPEGQRTDDRRVILAEIDRDDSPFEVAAVTGEIANHVARVPRGVNADPADRIIVATAEVLGLPLVSADGHIPRMTANQVVW